MLPCCGNGALINQMLGAFEEAVVPGVSEQELLAVMSDQLLRGGGEYLATSTVCSGPNTNPWRSEATDRRLEAGDLVLQLLALGRVSLHHVRIDPQRGRGIAVTSLLHHAG